MAAPTYKAGSAASDNWGGSAGPRDFPYTVPALTNGYLIVAFGAWKLTPANVLSVTWNSGAQSLTRLGTRILSGDGDSMELWGIKNPTAATANIALTWDADPAATGFVALCYEGVDQTTPIVGGSYTTNTGAGGTPATATLNVAASANDLVLAYCWNDTGTALFTQTGSQNERIEFTNGAVGTLAAYDLVAAGASTTMAASYSSTDKWVEAGVALAQIGGAPPANNFMWLS